MLPNHWFLYLNFAALYSPLVALIAAVVIFVRYGKLESGGRRSLGLFILGFLGTGVLFYVLGFGLGSYFSCRETHYTGCTLAGLVLVGPFSFSVAAGVYLYLWAARRRVR